MKVSFPREELEGRGTVKKKMELGRRCTEKYGNEVTREDRCQERRHLRGYPMMRCMAIVECIDLQGLPKVLA